MNDLGIVMLYQISGSIRAGAETGLYWGLDSIALQLIGSATP